MGFDARVVVKPLTESQRDEEQTESGIFLPDTAAEQGQTANRRSLKVGPRVQEI